MKISVITATWNSAATIQDTLHSLAAQTYDNIEYIIIDGGSTDHTLELIKNSGVKVDILVSEKDKGIYDALNKGIQRATGDVIGFLHSDDIFASNESLSWVAHAFKANEVDAVYADLDYVSKENPDQIIRRWVSGAFQRNKMKNGWMPPHPTFYMKRACYQRMGGFNLSYRIAADYESLLRYIWKGQIALTYIPHVLIKMRVGGASNRSLKNIIQKSKEDLRAMKENHLACLRAILGKNLSKIPQFFKK